MMFKRSSSTPVRPSTPMEEPITRYQQPLQPGPLSSPSILLPFNIGSTIYNPKNRSAYQLVQPLGNGSYAVVYMVREKNTGKFYALKCLSKANLSDYHLEIQHNEVRIHEQLSHHNIVELDHYFETPDWLFLVLEYCEGQDLYYWLTQNNDGKDPLTGKLLSEEERLKTIKKVFMQILDAVGYCHEKGIAHRDLKPENFIVMVRNDGVSKGIQVKLTDFGLATDEEESVDFDCGSKPYMSYECRNPTRNTYNTRLADIWSLGIILLNLLYHRSPWTDPNPEECELFNTFQYDKASFLMEKFLTIPKGVAQFFAARVFCNAEEGRIGIKEWRKWCDKFVERMLNEEIELEDVFDDVDQEFVSSSISEESSSFSQRQREHDYNQSWTDVLGKFEDFDTPVTKKRNSHSSLKKIQQDTIERNVEKREDETKDETQAESANNSDADSGFGTDEDINGNVIKRLKEREENSNITESLSVSPPKVIYCKAKPWGDYRSRGYQRDNSIENGSNISNAANNNHWSSYNQRRERLEQRRKEKQEQTLNSLGAYRRRGSLNVDTSSSSRENIPPRRRPQRPSNLSQESIYTAPQRRNVPTTQSSLHNNKSSQINNFPSSSPKAPVTSTSFYSNKVNVGSEMSRQRSPRSFDKTPKKVGKSTKNHLGKMLAGVVMFNRGVKIGGQAINEND